MFVFIIIIVDCSYWQIKSGYECVYVNVITRSCELYFKCITYGFQELVKVLLTNHVIFAHYFKRVHLTTTTTTTMTAISVDQTATTTTASCGCCYINSSAIRTRR